MSWKWTRTRLNRHLKGPEKLCRFIRVPLYVILRVIIKLVCIWKLYSVFVMWITKCVTRNQTGAVQSRFWEICTLKLQQVRNSGEKTIVFTPANPDGSKKLANLTEINLLFVHFLYLIFLSGHKHKQVSKFSFQNRLF